ncbi:hypothetical protein [Pelagibaculum spongiae]|uniref:DUF4440 domain-containing protein n=1 Tax=Pelagibaculum spongiae TaxID=2080658 RepID=A0A2V1H5C5_9GAMM|nr:hypothetical protein [Pelagibaculum spongiae]PVZ72407.1 hypothetical protein DC094_05220 [Pelagibaculum spongiae]
MDDKQQIIKVITQQFEGFRWDQNTRPNWDSVRSTFHPDAICFPSRRPAMAVTPREFIQRMDQLRIDGVLTSFSEKICFYEVQCYPNMASVTVGCEMTENQTEVSYDINSINMIFDDGRWQICSQAWVAVNKEQCQLYFSKKEQPEE